MRSRAGAAGWAALGLAALAMGAGGAGGGFRTAVPGYRYEFPRDHFNHPEFQTEWWYYTGNLADEHGRRFGFELTFFREAGERGAGGGKTGGGARGGAGSGVSSEVAGGAASGGASGSEAWGVPDVYLAHYAVSDLDGGRFYHAERMNRPGVGIAGVDEGAGTIWNGNWRARWEFPAGGGIYTKQRLEGVTEGFGIDLEVESRKPPVIHGRDGVSQKAAGRGRASYYISFTRLLTRGVVTIGGVRYRVEGTSWMDHEFFTEQLDPEQVGWDWFSVQLDDGSELMLFEIRRKDGSVDPYSAGTYVDAGGRARHLSREEFQLVPGERWRSGATKAAYPVRWTIAVPSLGLRLEAGTRLESQEMTGENAGSPSYWEGAIQLKGTRGGAAAEGRGYLEMTGYDRAVRLGG